MNTFKLFPVIGCLSLLVGCKSLKYYDLEHPELQTENKLANLTPIINTSELPKKYYLNGKKSSYNDIPNHKIAKPSDYIYGLNSYYSDLSSRYFNYVYYNLNKRSYTDYSNEKENVFQNTSGEICLSVQKYRRPRNLILSTIFTGSWATFMPMLVGVPVGHRKAKLELQIDIKNKFGDVIKTYKTTSKHTSIIGCYWGYDIDNASRAAHFKALNKGLKRLSKNIDKDAPYINGKLFVKDDYIQRPDKPDYLTELAKGMIDNGNYYDAIYVLNKAIELNANVTDNMKIPAAYYLALCLNQQKSYKESSEWLTKAENQNKELVNTHKEYGHIKETNFQNNTAQNLKLLEREQILAYNTQQLKIKENYEGQIQARELLKNAENFFKDKNYTKALENYEKAFTYLNSNDSKLAEAYYHFGDCYTKVYGENEHSKYKMIENYKRSYQLNPSLDVMVPALIFIAYKSMDKYEEANEWYQKSISHVGCNDKLKELINKWKKEMEIQQEQLAPGKKLKEKPVNVTITNMGANVNGKYNDYFPSMAADESVFLFTSRREGSTGIKDNNGLYDEDIWYCEKQTDGSLGITKNMGKPVNITNNNALASFTGDGQYVVTCRCNEPNGYGSCDNYFSTLTGTTWSEPQNMGSLINSAEWDAQACISTDGQTLIWSSDRKNGFGNADLWISYKDSTGKWSNPKNLGATINTSGSEYSPYLHPDGKSLYFASDNLAPRIGGHDIYKSILQADGTWSKPENLGYPINTESDDFQFILAPSGVTGYFTSSRPGGYGEWDIYRIDFPQENKTSLITFVGYLYDVDSKQPISGEVQIDDIETNEKVGTYKTNEASGKFVVVLKPGKNYSMTINKKEYLFFSENFNIPDTNKFQEIKKDIYLQRIKTGNKIVLKNIFFDSGKSTLKHESYSEIEKLYKLLIENPNIKVEISGHTDNTGNANANKQLSKERAEVVTKALISKGIENNRLLSAGYGDTAPITTNTTEEGKQQNRRTEFKVL